MDEEQDLLKLRCPRAWNKIVERLEREASSNKALVFEMRSPNRLSIEKVDKRTGLTVEYSSESYRVCVDCKFSRQNYQCEFDPQIGTVTFVSEKNVPYSLERLCEEILVLLC